MVLEKTLESPLDCKEFQPVRSEGDQPWDFFGRNNAKLVIGFLTSSKRLLISWLQSPSAVILEHPKIKSVTFSIVSPSICHEVMGLESSSSFFEF